MGIIQMPKIECPFERGTVNGQYVVIDKIAKGMEWVFSDDITLAIEKLHGANLSIYIQNGLITRMWGRKRRLPFFNVGNRSLVDGVLNAYDQGYMEFLADGQHFGEVIGPGIESNPYKLEKPIWIPFKTYAVKNLKYESWGKYPKDFKSISYWFEKELRPLFANNVHSGSTFCEGIVFTHPDGRLAKLRRDNFSWYKGKRHKRE